MERGQNMSEYAVSMEHITKTFPGVKALDDVQLHLRTGEVMALLGENGAGKSTLMKILSGVYTRDSGEITIFGHKVEGDLNTKQAQELGVAIIHQELNMCQHLTVANNMFLGREIIKGGRLDTAEMNRQAVEQLAKLGIHDLAPDTIVGDLPVGRQQMVEIAKALLVNAKVLVMDEPSSALSNAEIEEMFRIVKELRSQGCAIVYISHRLQELHHIVDSVTIMRDGHYITEGKFTDFTMEQIIANMVGREITNQFPRDTVERGKKVLEVRNLTAGRAVKGVSFEAYEGEVLGFSGLVGAGRTEVCQTIFGIMNPDSGRIVLEGKEVKIKTPVEAFEYGIGLLPENRQTQGLINELPIYQNVSSADMKQFAKASMLDEKAEIQKAIELCQKISLKAKDISAPPSSLSGGNQQKVVFAKLLNCSLKVLILDEPTKGIDVGAKYSIYEIMNELAANGYAIIMVSSEMPEVLGMADRIVVMKSGHVTGEFDNKEVSQEMIMAASLGEQRKEARA